MKKQPREIERNEKPAIVRPEHFVLNPEDPRPQWRFAVRDDSPLGTAFRAGRLGIGSRRYTATDRYSAAVIYRSIWDSVNSGGVASFNPNRVGGGASEARASEKLCIARDLMRKLEDRMSVDNRFLVRAFVGEAQTGSEAVRSHIAGFDKTVWAALCMALDNLADAITVTGMGRVTRGTGY
jgi:hypothetical protein